MKHLTAVLLLALTGCVHLKPLKVIHQMHVQAPANLPDLCGDLNQCVNNKGFACYEKYFVAAIIGQLKGLPNSTCKEIQ